MKQKHTLYLLIFLAIFFVVSSAFFAGEYLDFYHKQRASQSYYTQIEDLEGKTTSFGSALGNDEIELMQFPDEAHLEYLENKILQAEQEVLVEVYIFTEKRLRDALIEISQRGVPVKVLLENNPYMAPSLNDRHFDDLASAGIDVRWGDSSDYALNHSKLLIIDDELFLSTGNFSYSLFTKNTDFMLHIQDSELLEVFREIFFYDYAGEKRGVYHDKLILSPDYSRSKLSSLISESSESIDMYFPYISDEDFLELLGEAEQRGVEVRIIVEEDFYEEEQELIGEIYSSGIELLPYESGKLHAKAMLFDDEILYVGSVNFSTYSFDKNREMGLLVENKKILQEFSEIFENDFLE